MLSQNLSPKEQFDFDREQLNERHNHELERAKQELEKEQLLARQRFYRYSEMLKETGFCDYSPLEQYLLHVKAINETPSGALLLPEEIEAEVDKIERATKEIITSSKHIERVLIDLSVDPDVSLQDIDTSDLGDRLNTLGRIPQYLFGICAKYHLISQDFSTFSYQSDYSTENQTEIERLVWDLNYYLQYLNECLQTHRLSLELSLVDNNNLYFQRLLNYLWILPKAAQKLAELLIQDLEGRDVRGKFTPVCQK